MAKKIPAKRKQIKRRSQISLGKKVIFNVIFGLMIITIFFMIEAGLRIAGYGIDTRVFIRPRYKNDLYVYNVNFTNKYFPRKVIKKSDSLRKMLISNQFSSKKSPRTLRGFLVGESTAQGFPYASNQSFGKITELALGSSGKYEKVELLNLGISAITSYCIKDISLKLLPYHPDFLVIYAGHNEYYGTISATTGGNYFTKNLYLFLKESRFFQFLFNFYHEMNPPDEAVTLMEEQFNQKRLPPNPKLDREVAANLLKNIDGIVKAYASQKIPVIIIEPVSNLYDLPPFSGEKDEDFQDFIRKYAELIRKNDREELDRFYQTRLQEKQYVLNANVRYLDALAQRILTGEKDPDSFILAKDLDTTPFRAKNVLLQCLRDYCHVRSKSDSNLFFIPLTKILAETNDPEIFGNKVFIDQLHFTQVGQRIVSRILADEIAKVFHFNSLEKQRIADFYRDDSKIDQAIFYLPAYRIGVYFKVKQLIENPPFNKMLIPYQRKDIDGITPSNLEPDLLKQISDDQRKDVNPPNIANYYFMRDRIAEGKQYLDAYQWIYPGCYRPYLIQARYGKTFTNDLTGTFENYQTAYLLSDKMKMIYDEVAQYLADQGRGDLFTEIEKYGRPDEREE